MSPDALRDLVITALEDLKGRDIISLEVTNLTSVTDFMLVVSGTSGRHVKSLVDHVVETAKHAGVMPRGVEGREANEWVLVDLGDVIVHVMQVEPRAFYDLERLWTDLPSDTETLH